MSDLDAITAKCRRFAELRNERDEAKKAAETVEKEYREYESELFDELEESPLAGALKFDFGPPLGTIAFSLRTTYYGRIIDAAEAVEFFDTRGELEEMTKPKIEGGKLNEKVRELVEQGKPMPPGIDFYPRRGISISKKG